MKNSIDFIPSQELLEVQAIVLGLFKEFRRVCQKYHLKFFAGGGTLLGAARHEGFIPWDDDMDILMMWEDFQKLMEIAPAEFNEPFFFQCYKYDKYAEASPTAKLRHSETTGCTKWEYENIKVSSHHRGIFIDIFPLFAVPDEEEARIKQKRDIEWAWRAIRGWNAVQNKMVGYPSQYEEYILDWQDASQHYDIKQLKQHYIDACAMMEGPTDLIGITACRTHYDKLMWKRSWFDEIVELPFEDTTISCPKRYEEVLTKQYGDWKTPVFNGASHEMFVCDPNIPYYCNEKLK